jgi:hypothetical protein
MTKEPERDIEIEEMDKFRKSFPFKEALDVRERRVIIQGDGTIMICETSPNAAGVVDHHNKTILVHFITILNGKIISRKTSRINIEIYASYLFPTWSNLLLLNKARQNE